MTVQTLIVASLALLQQSQVGEAHVPQFSDVERQRIVAFWSEPGRYTVGPISDPTKDPWEVRLPAQASQWFWNYNKARGFTKLPPSKVPPAQNEQQRVWEDWINAKVARDRWTAGKEAEMKNVERTGNTRVLADTIEPPDPGPIPEGLKKLAGDAPKMAVCVQPREHTIRFDDHTALCLQDFPPMHVRYAYFRNPQGVMSTGTPVKTMPKAELDSLFSGAGMSPFQQRVMKAVSMLEGGFDSINTYDTGFVSVGLIQFACLKAGAGSLGSMLLSYKTASPISFDSDFRRYGLDVDPKGYLVAIDPVSGKEVVGADAAKKIIDEVRLAAVFQRAGKQSKPFKIAQIKAARSQFYPGNDVVSFTLGDRTVSVKVKDFVKTEAGMATLMDRKVNTGRIDPLGAVLTRIVAENGIEKVSELPEYEFDITEAMKYRRDYLAEVNLSQPDRHGKRGARSPKK